MTAHAPASTLVHDSPEAVGRSQRLGVLLLIGGDVAFVLSLVFTYLYLRGLNTEGGWIPEHGHVVGSGLRLGHRRGDGRELGRLPLGGDGRRHAGSAAARPVAGGRARRGGPGPSVYQLATAGIVVADGAYASAWMALSGYHAVHLALTLFIGIGVWNRARLGRFATDHWHVRLVGYWWTWVAASAVLTAATTSLTTIAHAASGGGTSMRRPRWACGLMALIAGLLAGCAHASTGAEAATCGREASAADGRRRQTSRRPQD